MDIRVEEEYQESGTKEELNERTDSPREVLYVHQHGILLHMQLISQQQQLHQLLIQTCMSATLACLHSPPTHQAGGSLCALLTLNLSVHVIGDDLQLSKAHVPHVSPPQISLH